MTVTTSYGSWVRHGDPNNLTVEATVSEALTDYPGIDIEAVTKAYRRAINRALPDSIILSGNEFYGPAWDTSYGRRGPDIYGIIATVDFWAIVEDQENWFSPKA